MGTVRVSNLRVQDVNVGRARIYTCHCTTWDDCQYRLGAVIRLDV